MWVTRALLVLVGSAGVAACGRVPIDPIGVGVNAPTGAASGGSTGTAGSGGSGGSGAAAGRGGTTGAAGRGGTTGAAGHGTTGAGGATATGGAGGSAGACAPLVTCGGVCVDTQHDPANCGGCGHACATAQFCSAGTCAVSCGAPFISCAAACIDPTSDGKNCGGCGKVCAAPQTCMASTCVCPGGLVACGSACVDTGVDDANCGGCGKVCASGQACANGVCHTGVSRWPTLGADIHHSGFNADETGTPPLVPAWAVALTNAALWPAVTDGSTIYVTAETYFQGSTLLSALSPTDGKVIWSYDFGDIFGIGQPTVDAGHVYVARCNNTPGSFMYAFVAATGKVFWTEPVTAQWEHYWAPLVIGPRMYFDAGEYGGLYGLSTADGSQLFFNSSLEQYDEWSPLYVGGTVYSFVEGNLRAHDELTGKIVSTASVTWDWRGWSMLTAPISDGAKIYFIAPPNLFAYLPGQTTSTWTANGGYQGMPAVASGVVYAISAGQLRANDAGTGAVQWTFPADSALKYPPVIAGRWVYVASDANVYAVDTTTQKAVWSGAPGGWLSIAGGQLLVAQSNGILSAYALTPATP